MTEATASAMSGSMDPVRAALNSFVGSFQDAPAWQRDALRRLYAKQKLTPQDIDELFNLCRQQHGLLRSDETALVGNFLNETHAAAPLQSTGPVALATLENVRNVNALAENQALKFSTTGLTIVYGDNGSGKTGYGRILKRACRARDQEEILPNAYAKSSGKPSALIKYFIGDVCQSDINWQDDKLTESALSSISVFDSKCASIHVDGMNELAYTPVPLQILQALAETCRELSGKLKVQKIALEAQIPSFRKNPFIQEGTTAHKIIINLSATSKLIDVQSAAQLSDAESIRLEQLSQDLALDTAKEIRRLTAQKQRVLDLIVTVRKSDEVLLATTPETLKLRLQDASIKAAAANLAANEAFNKEPLPQAGTEVWKLLWDAARAFSTQEAYPRKQFPNTEHGAVCVLCQQELSTNAKSRLSGFEKFVQEKVQQIAASSKIAVQVYKDQITKSCITKDSLKEVVRLLRDDLDQPTVCIAVVRNLVRSRVRRRRLIAIQDANQIKPYLHSPQVADDVQKIVMAIERRIDELQKTANPEQRKLKEKERFDLDGRKWLESILTDVAAEIQRLKTIAALSSAIGDTETNRITRKSTEISKALVTDKVRDAFAAEVANLHLTDRRLELTQQPSGYGSTRFKISLIRNPKAKVAGVLSEGEHRCVALAAFLAELSTAHNESGIIFDDPVSSLDHNYREAVATRLVREAATGRQVIVFTHDIPFLMMLTDEGRKQNQQIEYQCVNRAQDHAGVCVQGAPFKALQAPEIVGKLENRLLHTTALHASGRLDDWSEQVKAMAGLLRDGWERASESYVRPVVQRYVNKVHPGGLRKLTILTEQDFIDLNEGYAFACLYCHTDSDAINRPPITPQKVSDEISRLKNWCDSVKSRQDQKK